MKKTAFLIGIVVLAYFLIIDNSEARDGRQGGGGGRSSQQHQGHRNNAPIARTPSMSRSGQPQEHRPPHNPPPPTNPQGPKHSILLQPNSGLQGQGGSGVLTPPGSPPRLSPGLQGQSGSGLITPPPQIRQFTQNQRNIHRAPPGQKPPGFSGGFSNQHRINRDSARHIQKTVRQNRPWVFNSFDDHFFDSRNFRPRCFSPKANWWFSAPWVGVNTWLNWGWSAPLYYDEGYTYPDNSYEPYTSPEIKQETQEAIQGDWLSLGIFITGQSATQASFSNIVIQLALNKKGEISGTYYNAATDKAYEIEGLVDKESQQAVWSLSNNPFSPIMSTGIYNLTQDQTTVLVNFPDGIVQTWVLVRLNQDQLSSPHSS